MKKLILLFSLLAIFTATAQKADYKAMPTEFVAQNNIFEVPNKTASEIYNLSKVWMAKTYVKPDKLLVGDTKDVLMKIKYFFEIPSKKRSIKIKYNLILEFKDEKVKVTIDNIENSGGVYYSNFFDKNGNLKENEMFGIQFNDIESYVNNFIDSYVTYLNEKGNW